MAKPTKQHMNEGKSTARRAEMVASVNRLNREQKRIVIYLMCLLLEQRVRPSKALDDEIERLQHDVEIGALPSVPSVH